MLLGLARRPDQRPSTCSPSSVIVLVVLAWGQTVTVGFRTGRAWLPLVVLAGAA